MNYIYDITVNFNDVYLDFFEWNKEDKIMHIRKIPIIKVANKSFLDIYNNEIKINMDLLNKIYKKTEVYDKKKSFLTCCLFISDNNMLAIEFDKNGKSKKIGSINIEEELDILESMHIKSKDISYTTYKRRKKYYQTRNERKNKLLIKNKLNSLNIIDDEDKIKYLYFEYFNELNNNSKDALCKLKKLIDKDIINDNIKFFLSITKKI